MYLDKEKYKFLLGMTEQEVRQILDNEDIVPQYRIKKEGMVYTTDCKPTRLNIHINDEGIASELSFG